MLKYIMNKLFNDIKLNDLNYGETNEERIYKYLCKKYPDLKKTKDNVNYGKYYEFDFYNDNMFIELKTRRINFNQYPTLMFGYNKFLKGEELLRQNEKLKIYYLFSLNNGLYYWEHKSSPYTTKISGRCDRGKDEYHKCIHIETQYLKKMD